MNDFLERAFEAHLPPLTDLIEAPPSGAVCAMTGKLRQGAGCRLKKVVGAASADIADTFRFRSEWLGVGAARLYKGSRVLRGNLLALPDEGIRPFVSQKSATDERPCWRDLIFSLEIGLRSVAIFTDESKRRLWPLACLSVFGPHWRPLFNAAPYKGGVAQCRSLQVNVDRLRACLGGVERVYSFGFPKRLIDQGLICVSARKHIDRIGLKMVRRLDADLASWRGTDEFLLSLFVAQIQELEGEELWQQQIVPPSLARTTSGQARLF